MLLEGVKNVGCSGQRSHKLKLVDFKSIAFKHEPWWNGGADNKEREENEGVSFTKLSCIYVNGFFSFYTASSKRVKREGLDALTPFWDISVMSFPLNHSLFCQHFTLSHYSAAFSMIAFPLSPFSLFHIHIFHPNSTYFGAEIPTGKSGTRL